MKMVMIYVLFLMWFYICTRFVTELAFSTNDNTRFNHPEYYPAKEIAYTHAMANIDNVSFI